MTHGCAPVTTRVGLGASLVDGKQALLLEKPESPHLYESVKRLILNPDLRRTIGAPPDALHQALEIYDRTLCHSMEA